MANVRDFASQIEFDLYIHSFLNLMAILIHLSLDNLYEKFLCLVSYLVRTKLPSPTDPIHYISISYISSGPGIVKYRYIYIDKGVLCRIRGKTMSCTASGKCAFSRQGQTDKLNVLMALAAYDQTRRISL